MKVYVDNDIAVKLAQWGLLSRFTNHLQKQGKADLYMVPSLPFKFRLRQPSEALKMLGSQNAVQQLSSFVATCKKAVGHNQDVAKSLVDLPNLDAGEVTLFAAAAHYDAVLVDTGDKKALRAVGRLGEEHPVAKALSSKLACLEQTMHYLVGRWTFEVVRGAVQSYPAADTATNACFQSTKEPDVLKALTEKVSELEPDCGHLLAIQPFSWVK